MNGTRQIILKTSLDLFAKNGFQAVSVYQIANAVGIKAPSLYKHFASKQEIFDSCVKEFSQRIEKIHEDIGMPDTSNPRFAYETVSEEKLREVAETLFMFYLLDDVAAKFRKLLLLERYHNTELNAIFEKLFIDGAIEYETNLFSKLIEEGSVHGATAEQMALYFYTPIFFLLQKYDMRHNQLDLAKKELGQAVTEFCRLYGGCGK